jgi:ligand-binding sensor domain-containing protein
MQKQDSMKLLRWAAYPAWSMRSDNGRFWLAGPRGVYFRQGDSIVLFKEISEAHDIAVFGDTVAVAHRNGVTLYKRNTGESLAQFADNMICWHIAKYDSLLVFGGIDKCVVEKIGICHSIRIGSDRNLLWSTVRDTAGYLYMGTQHGLFRAKPDDSVAVCVGYKGICVKSLLIDSKNRLWVGRFFRQGKKWLKLW